MKSWSLIDRLVAKSAPTSTRALGAEEHAVRGWTRKIWPFAVSGRRSRVRLPLTSLIRADTGAAWACWRCRWAFDADRHRAVRRSRAATPGRSSGTCRPRRGCMAWPSDGRRSACWSARSSLAVGGLRQVPGEERGGDGQRDGARVGAAVAFRLRRPARDGACARCRVDGALTLRCCHGALPYYSPVMQRISQSS